MLGWVGIGEKILRLPRSDVSRHPHQPKAILTAGSEDASRLSDGHFNGHVNGLPNGNEHIVPVFSKRNTPNHHNYTHDEPPPSSSLAPMPVRRLSTRLLLSTFVKSLICFSIQGLFHDLPFIPLHANTHPNQPPLTAFHPRNWLLSTPFFALQPFALALEAIWKYHYRRMKSATLGIRPGMEPGMLIMAERWVGFWVVWIWLGWTGRYAVRGFAHAGMCDWDGMSGFCVLHRLWMW